jgi:hypothetical protein
MPLLDVSKKQTNKMVQMDLASARTKWLNEADSPEERLRRKHSTFLRNPDEFRRTVDFHSLRKTFITNLTKTCTPPRAVQLLARHSSIRLTMDVYSDAKSFDLMAGVEALAPVRTTTFDLAPANLVSADGPTTYAIGTSLRDFTQEELCPATSFCLVADESGCRELLPVTSHTQNTTS